MAQVKKNVKEATEHQDDTVSKYATIFLIIMVDLLLLKPYKSHYEKEMDGDSDD